MSLKNFIATRMLQLAQQQKDEEDQEKNGTSSVTAVQTNDPYVRWSTYVRDNMGVDNAATAKLRDFMSPANQVKRANDFFSGVRSASNPYTHPDNAGHQNPYGPGTVLYDIFDAAKYGKELSFGTESAIEQIGNMNAYEKMGINDPYLAIAARNDVANQLNEALNRGMAAQPAQYDTYSDRNAGKGYMPFGGQAGDVHKYGLEYENVLAAFATKKNRKEGLKDSVDTMLAGDYASLSDKYIDSMIANLSDYLAGLDDKINAGTLYDQEYFQRMSLNELRCEAYSAEDLYNYARDMFPGQNWSTGDFDENGDPDKISRITDAVNADIADMRAGNGGKVLNAYDAIKGERMTVQAMLDDLRSEKTNRALIADLEKRYAHGNGQPDYASMIDVDEKGTDIVSKMLYMNLHSQQRGNWDDEENAWLQEIADQMGGRISFNDYSGEGYQLMTPDEVELVNKVWNLTHDPIKTQAVYDAYASTLRDRRMNFDEDVWAYNSDFYGSLMTDLASIVMQGYANVEGAINAVQGLFGNQDVKDITSDEWRTQNEVNAIRNYTGQQAYNSGGALGKFLHDAGIMIGDEGMKFLPALAGGPLAQQVASGIAGFAQGTYGAYERGVDDPLLSTVEGLGMAGIDVLTENLNLGTPGNKAMRAGKHMLKQIAAEGLEEGASEILQKIAGNMMADVTGTVSADEQAYMDAIKNSEETDRTKRHMLAKQAVADQNIEDVLYSTVMGGVAGGVLSAPGAIDLSNQQRKLGKTVSNNSNSGALMDVAMSMAEGSEARQLAETMKAQADKGKKPSNGQLGRLYAATAKDLDEQSAAVLTETMQDAIVDEMVDKGETEEVARRAAPILAKQLRGEKLTKADTQALVESKTATTMMEELNKHTEGGKEDGPKTGLFKRTNKGTKAAEQQQDEAGSKPKPLQRPAWVDDVEIRQAVYAAPKSAEIASKGKALADTTRPSTQTAISKSGDKAKTLTVKEGAAKEGVRDTTAVPFGSKGSETVDIQRIEADKDGVLKVVTKDAAGKESKTSYQMLSFKGGSVGHVITHAVDNYAGNAEMANLMYQGYTGGDSTQYIAEMDAAYRAGFDAVAVDRDSMGKYNGVAQHAFELGQKQAQEGEQTRLSNIGKAKLGKGRVAIPASVDESKLSKPQRNQVAIVRRIADATGINFTFFESQSDATGMYKAENGSYDPDTNSIRLDLNAGKNFKGDIAEYAIVRTAAHEMTHFIEANSSENYAKMRQFIADELARKGLNFNSLVQAKIDRSPVPLTRGGAIAEVVADGCEMMLKDSEAIQRLMQKDASLGEQIKKVLMEFIGRIRKAFENIRPDSIEAKALMDEVDGVLKYADELQKMWDAGLEEAVEATRGDGLTENGVIVENKTAYANPQLSVRTWNASGYVQERDTMAKELAAKTGVTVSKATKWLDDVNSIASMVLSDPLRLDYISSEFGSAFKSNPEYGGSVDMSTLCPKRRLATGTLDAIQDRLGDVALTRDDFLRLRAMMAERGHEVACGLCFVESSRANLSKYNKQFIDLYNATHPDQDPVTMGGLNTIDGLENIRSERPDVYVEYEKFMNKLAQRKPKLFEKRTEYDGEILKKFRKDTSVDAKNRNGGLRLQSFSDFELVHLIDMMQVITDMASVGLAGQAYTKVPDFAWALGDTGLKINLSLIAKGVDENGKLIFNDIEGMNHVEAKKLRDAYSKNVGTILVTFTDEQLIAAMQDDFVDFIIPFHRSQWKKTDYRILGLPEGTKDYTLHQNEKLGRKRVKENFMPNEYWDFTISGKENAQKYLGMCNAEGRTPKFAKFLQKNADGTYSLKDDGSTDGYWKLLIDFKMYDNDGNGSKQLPVQPNFNMEQAARMLNEYKGGHETLPVAWDVVEDFVAEYQGKKSVQYSPRVGYTREGLAVYASNFADGTTMPERQARILSLVQNVWAEKPIELEIVRNGKRETIVAHFDPYVDPAGRTNSDATKLAYGNRKGTASDRKTTSKLANDFPEIIASSSYDHSSEETGKTTFTHDGVLVWHYFANRIGFIHEDGRYAEYDVSIDVKEREDGAFVYAFAAVKRKGSERSEAPSLVGDPGTMNAPVRGIAPAIATTSIPENGENGNGFSQKSLRTPAPATTRDYLLSLTDADLSTDGEKDAMKRYRVMVDELRELEEKRAAQQEIAATATGDERIKAKNRADIYTVQIDRLNDRIRGKENTNVLRPIVAEAKAILEANRQLDVGRPMEEVVRQLDQRLQESLSRTEQNLVALDKQLREATAKVDKLNKSATAATAKAMFDSKDINQRISSIKQLHGNAMSSAELSNRLALMYATYWSDLEGNGPSMAMNMAQELARDIVSRSKSHTQSWVFGAIRENLGSFSLNEKQLQELNHAGYNINSMRSVLSGVAKYSATASSLDSKWEELCAAVPSLDPTASEGDQITSLIDLISREKQTEQGFDHAPAEQVEAELLVSLLDMPTPQKAKAAGISNINAIKAAATDSASILQELEDSAAKASNSLKNAKSANLSAGRIADEAQKAVEYYKALYEKQVAKTGSTARQAEEKLLRFREKVQADRDNREKITSSRRRITKMVKYLDTLRRKESDYKHVPEELKPTVNALVAAFAEHSSMVFDSKRAERIAQAYSKLQALDNDLAAYYAPDVQARIEYIADLMELKRGKPMTLAEMEIIEDVVGAIYKMVRGSNEAFFEGQSMDIAQIAADVADEMLQRKDRLYRVNSKAEEGLDTLIRNGNLTPVYYFDNLNNAMLKRLGYDILGGQDKYGLYQRDDRTTMSDIRKKYNYNSWRNDKPIVHNDVQFTKEQALWVYATAKREATNELAQTHHLDEGGIVFEGGEVVGADGKKRKRTTPMRLSAKDVQAITSTLTEEQKGYADAVVQHLSTTVGERGNEVSMRMYGFRKYREQYYFPYKTASDQRHQTSVSNAVSATNDARLKHQSFSNPLKKGANTPLVIGDFTEMATSHMNAMNTYAAMVIPVENMNRVLNRKTEIDGAVTTLRGLMAQKYGDSTKRYLETLLKDLNGGAQVDNRTGGLIDKTIGLYKKGAVVGSASVVLQQWTSIFRAAYMINPKYLAGATFSKRDWAELVKYSGVATIKDMGRFDVNVGVGGSNWLAADADDFATWEKAKQMLNPRDWETFKTRWDDAVNFLPGWADRVTWAQIWNAVKAEQADQHPGMDKTSDAFLKMCAERFNDIINHTQVYDSTMTRSQLMRSKGALDKMATAFGSEPTVILNMVYDAIHNPAYKGKRKRKIGAGIATVTLSQLAAAAMQALASAWRKDDDERKALEKFLDKWSYNFADNMNPFALFPYLRDMYDTFATSYDVERSDMALFSELKDAISKLDNDSYSPYRKVEELAGTLAKFGGIPLKNIMRDLRSAYNAILKTDWSVPEASNIGYTLLDNLPFRDSSKTAYYQRMENAYASGDEERADDIAQYLERNDTTADAVGDKLSGMLKRMLAAGNDAAVDAILADMAARGRERDGSDLRKTINSLYKDGKITWQQAERLYKRHTNLTSANDLYWHKAEMDYKGEGNYTPYLAAREALMAGDKKTFLAEKSKLLSHGKEPKGITSAIGDLKDELLALYETDPVAARQLRDMIVWAYMECGKTKQSANRLIDGWFK